MYYSLATSNKYRPEYSSVIDHTSRTEVEQVIPMWPRGSIVPMTYDGRQLHIEKARNNIRAYGLHRSREI